VTKINKADNIIRYLDSGFYCVVWRNLLGSYSAALVKREDFSLDDSEHLFNVDEKRITDDLTPSKVLARLADKPLGNIEDNYV